MTDNAAQIPDPEGALDLDAVEPPEYLMASVNGMIRDMMNATLRRHGLKLVEWRVLQCLLEDDGPRTVAELAELAVIDRTVASRLIDKMVARGWVRKQALPQDKRYMNITVTADGRQLYETCVTATRSARARLFSGMSAADVDRLLRLLDHMRGNLAAMARR